MAVKVTYNPGLSGKTLFATAQRLSDGFFWNESGAAWEAAPTLANQKLSLSAGSASKVTVYEASFSAGMGDAGRILIFIHDDDVSGDLVIDTMPTIDVYGGVEVQNMSAVAGSVSAATNVKNSALAITSGTVVAAFGSANTALTFDTDLEVDVDDYYGNANGGTVLAFLDTAENRHVARRVVASTTAGSNTRVTVEEVFPNIPVVGDPFVILGRITELS